MAKIRSIKVEFWTSPQIVECSPLTRLFFIGLWNFCDDGGVHPYSVKRLKMQIFPADEDIPSSYIDQMLAELEKNKLVKFYTVADQKYIKITGWHHQKNYEQFFKYPQENGIVPANKKYDRNDPEPRKSKKAKPKTDSKKEGNSMSSDSQQSVNNEATDCQHIVNEHGNGNVNGNVNVNKMVSANALTRTNILYIFKTKQFSAKIDQKYYDELCEHFPRVQILQELRKMNQWYCDHPQAKITAASFKAHVRKWMAREQVDPFVKCKHCGKEVQKPREICYECENKLSQNKNNQKIYNIKEILEIKRRANG